MENIAILGSTGSIGTQTLEVVENLGLNVYALTAYNNVDLLVEQVKKYTPKAVCIANEKKVNELNEKLQGIDVEIFSGYEGLIQICNLNEIDIYVNSLDGSVGLLPTYTIMENKKKLALANKEVLIMAGEILSKKAKEYNMPILPIDSEHSAIFQCINGNKHDDIERLILTASGGPFRATPIEDLEKVTFEQAIKHPTWNMGRNITINSSTLMNKGFEVIEARWLFDLPPEKIDTIIHPQSIIHSMVEYKDGIIMGQIGPSDMRLPIQYALTYPNRVQNSFDRLDFIKYNTLTFEQPDLRKFRCLALAYEALKIGGTMPLVLCVSNEIAINKFADREIEYIDIPKFIEKQMEKHVVKYNFTIEDLLETEKSLKREFNF